MESMFKAACGVATNRAGWNHVAPVLRGPDADQRLADDALTFPQLDRHDLTPSRLMKK